ncbi:MAG: transglutaminase-like putative cysteine protease, partial [Paracoccaceae bacterium]
MAISVALTHRTSYRYDRSIQLSPHIVRLRPAPHARTPIESYSLNISPKDHFINWQQDPFANWMARLVFPERVDHFEITVDLIARLDALNPFDFFLEDSAQDVPFKYDEAVLHDLAPYLRKAVLTPLLDKFITGSPKQKGGTVDWLVAINQYVQSAVGYTVRMEPGVQTPEETLKLATGSCRDSGWLLVNMFRHLGYAARFVSGYLIQLTSDVEPIDGGAAGPKEDFTDLHAWTEVYVPGAGWVGLDPTSGLMTGEGHIPLAATPEPRSAAAVDGLAEKAEVEFEFEMSVTRLREPPRVTKPLTDMQWRSVDTAGKAVDRRMKASGLTLTMGGEPTFVSAYDRDAPEWTADAVGPTKRSFADKLIRKLRERFAPDGMLHYGQGKWYPGEQLPRWAFALYWRGDGMPLWTNQDLIAPVGREGAKPPSPEAAE